MKKLFLFVITLFISLGLNAQYWSQQNTNMAGTATGVDQVSVVDSNIVWVNGFNGSGTGQFIKAHARTNDGGATWVAGSYSGFGANVQTAVLTGVTYDKAFAIAYDTAAGAASFWQTTDGGNTWAKVTGIMNTGTTTFADGVKFWDSSKGFCYGDPVSSEFDIYTTTDGGTTWNDVDGANIPDPASASEYGYNGNNCACIVPGGIGFFLTNAGRIFKTTDYGATWTVCAANPFTSIPSSGVVYASSANYIIAGSYDSGSSTWSWKVTTDGGATWNSFTIASGTYYEYQMCYVPGTANMFVATSPFYSTVMGIGYSYDGGLNWSDYMDATYLQPGGSNIQCLGVGFYDITTGWVGNYNMDTTSTYNSILKYSNPNAASIHTYSLDGNDLNIYPNPSNGEVYFSVNGPSDENMILNVYDIAGNVVYENTLNVVSKSICSYDFSSLSKGIYIAKISGQNENITHKLVIQ